MANPKYADLPGIAVDQPDVYETNDLPESEQIGHSLSEVVVDQSDSIENVKVTPNEAFNHFKGKTLDATNVDFTDSIGYKRKTGYDARSGEFEMLGQADKDKETPYQAYNRLQFEVKGLIEKVHELKEMSEDSKKSQMPPAALAAQLELIQKELQDLHMEQILGSETIQEMSDPLGTLHKKLMTQIENFKKQPVVESKEKHLQLAASDALTYELFVRPEQSKLEETAKIAELEKRLKYLENVIGPDKNKMNFLTSNTDDKSIVSALSLLSSKLNLLDPAYLDQVENRLALLHQFMQQIGEKKQQIEDSEKQNKISELYELAKKVDTMSVSLPQVVERLVALKDLHEQALQFSKALTQLDTVQQQLANSMNGNEKLLKEVKETFGKNMEVVEKNISSLNSRITALQK